MGFLSWLGGGNDSELAETSYSGRESASDRAALAHVARRPAEPAPVPVLFAALLVAHAVRDRAGARLLAIVRRGGA